MKKVAGPGPFYLLKSLPSIKSDILSATGNMLDTYGDDVCFRFFKTKSFLSRSADFHHYILKEKHEIYKKSFAYDLMEPIFGKGLLVAHGDHWKQNRIRMNPAFGPNQLKAYAPKIEKLTLDLLLKWSQGQAVNVHEDIIMLTLGIIGECLFGKDIRSYGPHVSQAMLTIMDYVETKILNPFGLPQWVPSTKNKKYLEAIKTIDEISDQLIKIVLSHKKQSEDEKTLLARLLPEGEMTPELRKNLRDQIMTLLITGHDTSANVLAFALQVLSQHPDMHREILEEIEKDPEAESPLLNSFLNEVMRLYPPVWMTSRVALQDDGEWKFPIQKGSLVILVPYFLHRHPDIWQKPEDFVFKRFLEPYPVDAYLPFSTGPRGCVAMTLGLLEMKIILKKILLELNFESLSPIKVRATLTLKPDGPVPMKFKRRKVGP